MNTDDENIKIIKHEDTTEKIIKIFYKVYGKLGYGFLEKVYQNAMLIELRKEGIQASAQYPIKVLYDNELAEKVKPQSCKYDPLNSA